MMEPETPRASGQFSDWVLNLGDHIYDERLKVIFAKVYLYKRLGLVVFPGCGRGGGGVDIEPDIQDLSPLEVLLK